MLKKPELFLELVNKKDAPTVRTVKAFLKEHKKTVFDGIVKFRRIKPK
jgi:hypothetical protein